MLNQVSQRLIRILEVLKMTPAEFGRLTGISKQMVSNYLSGKTVINLKALKKIKNVFPEINTLYLMNGKGHPLLTPDDLLLLDAVRSEDDIEVSQEQYRKKIKEVEDKMLELREELKGMQIVLHALKKTALMASVLESHNVHILEKNNKK